MFEIISSNIFVKTGNSAFSNVYFRGFAEGLVVVEIISSNIFVKTGTLRLLLFISVGLQKVR